MLLQQRQRMLLALRRQYRTLPMPALSPTMTNGRIASWKKKDGEVFKVDEVLCEVETDKAVVDFSAVEEGVLAKILVKAGGDPIPVGAPVALVVDDQSEVSKAVADYEAKSKTTTAPATQATAAPIQKTEQQSLSEKKPSSEGASGRPAEVKKGDGKPVPVSPSARSLLGEHIDFTEIVGSGKNGRIMKEDAVAYLSRKKVGGKDVSAAAPSSASAPVPSRTIPAGSVAGRPARVPAQSHWLPEDRGPFRDVPLTMMRRVIAQRLSESKDRTPHMYATMDADIESALEARNSLKKLGMPTPSMNDLVIRACALALKKVPSMNVRVEGDKVVPNEKIDISVAVATPGGLITPIVESADKKNPVEISTKIRDLAARAKENKLKPAEFQGGSFTVSNLGMFGVDDFTAIINAPQVAILAVGSGKSTLHAPDRARGEVALSALQTRTKMTVALSFDPRAVSEVDASKFLQSFQTYIESPAVLFST